MSADEQETVHFHDWHAVAGAAEQAFAAWAVTLAAILPPNAEIEHIGATAVPGCLTKGDLDILVRVARADFAAAEAALAARFDRNLGSVRTSEFAAFADEAADPPLGVQLAVRGGELDDFLAFRDLLRADPALLAAYNALKRRHHGGSMQAYRSEKDALIARALADLRPHAGGMRD